MRILLEYFVNKHVKHLKIPILPSVISHTQDVPPGGEKRLACLVDLEFQVMRKLRNILYRNSNVKSHWIGSCLRMSPGLPCLGSQRIYNKEKQSYPCQFLLRRIDGLASVQCIHTMPIVCENKTVWYYTRGRAMPTSNFIKINQFIRIMLPWYELRAGYN